MKTSTGASRTMLWATGAVYGTIGLFVAVFDHPLVPLSHVFHLIPICVGSAVGAAVLRENYGPRWIAAYYVGSFWMVYATLTNETTIAPVALFMGIFSLVRGMMQWVAENGG